MLDATKQAILETYQGQVLALSGDISDETFVDQLIGETANTFGRLDYVVNCAGILGGDLRATETSVSTFDQITRVNYRSVWLCSRAAFAQMLRQETLPQHPDQRGAVVNIASQLGLVARAGAAPYCGSKAAVIHMTRADAIDYSRDSIRVNCICPGVIATSMAMGSSDRAERFKPAVDIAPMKRMGTPDEVANAVLFLCSPLSSFVQGHALVVDGGYTIN
ncbi:SDR family NAD(P)-dependent oxidoreductase [Aspergillus vadensis CBS 113365]|uniref:Oxidoreductase n=1 Tax=Aspergillus vadensis (strain CBS 113365 / IMI 142717 / IBT 24658) TaxID=1448311 RepID=A0A319B856_ASPVC|nr:oxidoreductase [Aspergillus vadensis CBS 113365]PYH68004.1 oxidoreductase [Aspergillus vadensis CBS 113365]